MKLQALNTSRIERPQVPRSNNPAFTGKINIPTDKAKNVAKQGLEFLKGKPLEFAQKAITAVKNFFTKTAPEALKNAFNVSKEAVTKFFTGEKKAQKIAVGATTAGLAAGLAGKEIYDIAKTNKECECDCD